MERKRSVRGNVGFFFHGLKALQKYNMSVPPFPLAPPPPKKNKTKNKPKPKKSLSCMMLVLKTNKGSAGALTFIDLGWVMSWMVCKEIIHILRLTLRNITHKWLQMLMPIVPLQFCLFINLPCLPSNAQNVLICKKPLPSVLKKNMIYWTKYYAREFVSKNIFSPRTDFSSSPISVLAFFLCAGFSNLFKHF